MSDETDDLNYDCNYNLFLAKHQMGNLRNSQDRQKVLRWLRKLSACNRSIEEMKLRNDFMYQLVVNIQSGELGPPFNENPPTGPLATLTQLLPGVADAATFGFQIDPTCGMWAGDTSKSSTERPMVYKHSPDGGAFLAAQPVPKCGAFCYLAVVSPANEDT